MVSALNIKLLQLTHCKNQLKITKHIFFFFLVLSDK